MVAQWYNESLRPILGDISIQLEWKAHSTCLKIWVITAVALKIDIFWDMTLCILEGSYQLFRGICCLHLQGEKINLFLLCLRPQRHVLQISPLRATCSVHLILLDFIYLIMFAEKYRLWSSSFRCILQQSDTFYEIHRAAAEITDTHCRNKSGSIQEYEAYEFF